MTKYINLRVAALLTLGLLGGWAHAQVGAETDASQVIYQNAQPKCTTMVGNSVLSAVVYGNEVAPATMAAMGNNTVTQNQADQCLKALNAIVAEFSNDPDVNPAIKNSSVMDGIKERLKSAVGWIASFTNANNKPQILDTPVDTLGFRG